MASTDTQRRLAAILSADVAGYSRLMGADEAATVETLASFRKVFLAHIEDQRGRVVDAKGDALLAEFASVVDAVNAAVEIQRELAERNAELPDAQRMDWRIGVNLGDVIAQEDAIYGDGVNIAARLEALAEPGGVCISGSAYAQVRGKLALDYRFLGRKEVKNIAEPVPVYRVGLEAGTARNSGRRRWAVAAIGTVALLALGLGGYFGWRSFGPGASGTEEEQSTLPLPDKPSIAVLAFDNLSDDPGQEYFSDGISEDIITDLSKVSGLFVIARNSSFSYKGKAVNVQQVGRELGVKYVLEGSVRKAGGRIRLTAQLVDAATGAHRWAERYDRELQDVFALQDEITEKIVSALKVQLTMGETERVRRNTTDNLAAWEHYVVGMKELHHYLSTSGGGPTGGGASGSGGAAFLARIQFEKALKLDPDFSAALLGLGWTYQNEGKRPALFLQAAADPLGRARELAGKALELNRNAAEPYALLGQIHLVQREHVQALDFARRAVALAPNSADWRAYLADILSYSGRAAEAVEEIGKARRLNPFHPDWYLDVLGRSLYLSGRFEEAIAPLKTDYLRAVKSPRSDSFFLRFKATRGIFLLAAYSAAGREKEAAELAALFRGELPNFQPRPMLSRAFPFREQADFERLLADLAKAGLE